ncbi:MAG: PAS domain-containing protein, partial [Planctomycetes bacterium]|nr:PAS domain-containing protein [Planctomycetota bacterium]
GSGFLGAALLDGYHAIATSSFYSTIVAQQSLETASWGWTASRIFLSMFFFFSWLDYTFEKKNSSAKISEWKVYLVSGIIAIGTFAFFTYVPLPTAYYPDIAIQNPVEFIPAAFFLIALIGFLTKGGWKKDSFESWVVLSLIFAFIGQALYMSFSSQAYDSMFDSAHIIKSVSYVFIIVGLLIGKYHLVKEVEEESRLKGQLIATEQMLVKIEGEKAKLEAIISNINDGVIATDTDHRIILMNRQAELMIGCQFEEVKGMYCFEVLKLADYISESSGTASKNGHLYCIKRDGSFLKVDVDAAPIILGKNIEGTVVVLRKYVDRSIGIEPSS